MTNAVVNVLLAVGVSVCIFFVAWWLVGKLNSCGRPATGEKIVAAIEKAGVEFLDDGQGVRLKPAKAKGKRK